MGRTGAGGNGRTGPPRRAGRAGLTGLADALAARSEEIVAGLAERIRADVEWYADEGRAPIGPLRESCVLHVAAMCAVVRGDRVTDLDATRAIGARRATDGVPLAAVLEAFRVGARHLWTVIAEEAHRRPDVTESALIAATSEIWLAQDVLTQAVAAGYRDEATTRLLQQEHERSALVEALLRGDVLEHATLWEVADLLQLADSGPYIVVAAEVARVGHHALPGVDARLRASGVSSAWRLLPDLQVGIVAREPGSASRVVATCNEYRGARVGISPAYADLRDTARALRLARLALRSIRPGRTGVVRFDDEPLGIAAVSADDVGERLAVNVLGDLVGASAGEEEVVLLDTLEAWLDAGGSSTAAAARLHCHPNTVRHRLRRVESRTGRSLGDPRGVTELCLALETIRRRPVGEGAPGGAG